MVAVVARNIEKRFGSFRAVDDISFEVRDGEFLTLLGPSGCGKSTTLNILAGLDRPDAGFLSVGDEVFCDSTRGIYVGAERRNLGLVFQTYALWPHMTVRDNVAYALRLRRMPRREREERIREALALVEMDSFIDRYPSQLSGGQQQRVALARTLAYRPRVLLLDEPLSNLDAKLRDKARIWLRQLQTQVGVTTIFVTHDQIEALALSDRIAVMNKGKIVQIGTPVEIYERPQTSFVADFIGTTNFLAGKVVRTDDGEPAVGLPTGEILHAASADRFEPGTEVTVACRPERIEVVPGAPGARNVISAKLAERSYLGAHTLYELAAGGGIVKVESRSELGGRVALRLPPEHCIIFASDKVGR